MVLFTPASPLSHFPPDTRAKQKRTEFRLSSANVLSSVSQSSCVLCVLCALFVGLRKSPPSLCHPELEASVTKCQRQTLKVTQMVRLCSCVEAHMYVSLSTFGNTLKKTLKCEHAGGTTRLIAVCCFFYEVEERLRSAKSIFKSPVRG